MPHLHECMVRSLRHNWTRSVVHASYTRPEQAIGMFTTYVVLCQLCHGLCHSTDQLMPQLILDWYRTCHYNARKYGVMYKKWRSSNIQIHCKSWTCRKLYVHDQIRDGHFDAFSPPFWEKMLGGGELLIDSHDMHLCVIFIIPVSFCMFLSTALQDIECIQRKCFDSFLHVYVAYFS